ncbi:MAG: leucine-rich repeat domain-containing protein, partial [Verrucomicrobiae bacterium]|nr:leucine-rich repeat domain-containing protein [Verrucomicrobiae bacterium]
IPQGVTSISNGAFYGCRHLTRVAIPSTVTVIGPYAFAHCPRLLDIEVDLLNARYRSVEGVLFNRDQTVLLAYPSGRRGSYVIPEGVGAIGSFAFRGCRGLTSVAIPEGLTEASDGAFAECDSLTTLLFPSSLTSIGGNAFVGCPNLLGIYFQGDAPAPEYAAPNDLGWVFYREGTAGWGPSFLSRPTAVWKPRPTYSDWVKSTGLATQFPEASGETDDPDGDGRLNGDEWLADTDPTQSTSRLEIELTPRLADLAPEDQTSIPAGKYGVYFRSVAGRYYSLQSVSGLGEAWRAQATRIGAPGATQTRILLPEPGPQVFFRILVLP